MAPDHTQRALQTARVTTLLELVQAIAETGASDTEMVATVVELVASGRVRLIGSFRSDDVADGGPEPPEPRLSRPAA